MGCAGTKSEAEKSEVTETDQQKDLKSKEIEKQIRNDRTKANDEVKILLLGPGDSGKSTLCKQLRIICRGEFTEEELAEYRPAILQNLVRSFIDFLSCIETLGLKFENPDAEAIAKRISSESQPSINIDSPSFASDLRTLYNDKAAKEALSSKSDAYKLQKSSKYYLKNMEKFLSPNFKPSQEDVLLCRVPTYGIRETEIPLEKKKFRFVDVGGQRAERRKWISCFEDVQCVFFCVALSEFDQKLEEDKTVNRMKESLEVFHNITSEWFSNTPIIICFNKSDIFRKKLQKSKENPLQACFPDYQGSNQFDEVFEFIRGKFFSVDGGVNPKRVHSFVTCAKSRENIQELLNNCKPILLSRFNENLSSEKHD